MASKHGEQPDPFGSYVQRRRQDKGWSATELASKLGVSKSYVSLIESGGRSIGEELARTLAKLLDDPPELYVEWARAAKVAGERVPNLESVQVKLAKPSAIGYQKGRARHGDAQLRVPIVPEGTGPETAQRIDDIDYVSFDRDVLPKGERLVKPFAWRLSAAGAAHAPDILEPNDTVIISREPGEVVKQEIYAVRGREDVIRLSRVELKGDVLLLMKADGTVDDALHAHGTSPLSLILGKVAIVIRPWSYAVLKPRGGR